MTSASLRKLVDTNVFVYAVYPHEPQHETSRQLVETARNPDANLFITPQILAEFYATVTNPRRVTQPKSAAEALDAIEAFLALPGLQMLPVPINIISILVQLLRQTPVLAQEIYDAQLVAVMLGNDVTVISTFNDSDFRQFPGIIVETPTV